MLYPHLHLLVSGGNSQLIYLRSWQEYEVIGATLDDAAGECFDKAGRMLGLVYPGGIYLSQIAGLEDKNILKFPVAMKDSKEYNFSFSGLKTAIRYYLEKQVFLDGSRFELEKRMSEAEIRYLVKHDLIQIRNREDLDTSLENIEKLIVVKEVCITVQSVIVASLLNKVDLAFKHLEVASVGLSGGVSANPLLRSKLEQRYGEKLLLAPRSLTGDNAVMIGFAGILDWKYGLK